MKHTTYRLFLLPKLVQLISRAILNRKYSFAQSSFVLGLLHKDDSWKKDDWENDKAETDMLENKQRRSENE